MAALPAADVEVDSGAEEVENLDVVDEEEEVAGVVADKEVREDRDVDSVPTMIVDSSLVESAALVCVKEVGTAILAVADSKGVAKEPVI